MFFGETISNSKTLLNYSNTKNNTISNNLSNLNNPNYKRKYVKDISFDDTLKEQMKTTDPRHFNGSSEGSEGLKIKTDHSKGRNDNNNVDLDREIIDLESNQYLFQLNSTVLKTEYSKLLEAII